MAGRKVRRAVALAIFWAAVALGIAALSAASNRVSKWADACLVVAPGAQECPLSPEDF